MKYVPRELTVFASYLFTAHTTIAENQRPVSSISCTLHENIFWHDSGKFLRIEKVSMSVYSIIGQLRYHGILYDIF